MPCRLPAGISMSNTGVNATKMAKPSNNGECDDRDRFEKVLRHDHTQTNESHRWHSSYEHRNSRNTDSRRDGYKRIGKLFRQTKEKASSIRRILRQLDGIHKAMTEIVYSSFNMDSMKVHARKKGIVEYHQHVGHGVYSGLWVNLKTWYRWWTEVDLKQRDNIKKIIDWGGDLRRIV